MTWVVSGLRLVIIEVLLGLHRACWTKACDHEKYFVIQYIVYSDNFAQETTQSFDDDCEFLLGLHRAFCTNARDHEDVRKKIIILKAI